MVRLIGLWTLLLALVSTGEVFAVGTPQPASAIEDLQGKHSLEPLHSQELKNNCRQIKTDVLAKIEVISRKDEKRFMKTFYLGELNVLPYTPNSQLKSSAKSQAYFTFKLPDICGGVQVRTGLRYNLAENQKNGIGSREQVLYLVSTKTLKDAKWKPFVSLSYMRSQVRGAPKAFYRGLEELKNRSSVDYQGPQKLSSFAHYSNVEVLETCCGLQPHEKLSLVLAFNYLKPLGKKGIRLNTSHSKLFDDLKVLTYSQGVDVKLDYTLKEGINLLVKSQCLLTNGKLREKVDKPVVIEGSLIVSF